MVNLEKILEEIKIIPDFDDQIMLQTVEGETDPLYGTGDSRFFTHTEQEFTIPMFDLPYTNSIIKELGMYRTRIMKMASKYCYSYHWDRTQRVHIPLITNENCFFVIEDEVVRTPADGNHYLIDTRKKHTFVNASFEDRWHIVGAVDY